MPKKKSESFEAEKKDVMKYRYYCHGCTNTVYQSAKVDPGIVVTCPHCGKMQVTVAENFIAL